MSYGQIAIDTIRIIRQSPYLEVRQAWSNSLSANNKNDKACPKVAFLGLCEDGFINGIPAGNYIQKTGISVIKQKAVAIRGIIMNRTPPKIPVQSNASIWRQVSGSGRDQGVIEGIYTLFRNGDLI